MSPRSFIARSPQPPSPQPARTGPLPALFSPVFPSGLALLLFALPWGLGASAADAQPLRNGAILKTLETPQGEVHVIHRLDDPREKGIGTFVSFLGDTFSFEHQVGALIEGVFRCFGVHTADMNDDNVTFDGITELLDPYLDGTQPALFEFESMSTFSGTEGGSGTTNAFFNSFSDTGTDLFPEGFTDPETGSPLDAACLEIGISDTLDSDKPAEVQSAMFEASGDRGTIIPNVDISSIFSSPFDGRVSVVFPGQAGQGINGLLLDIELKEAIPEPLFADGFESGDAAAWTNP